jgi:hypothetical protein
MSRKGQKMRDRTAQTEPLTIGQRTVANYEMNMIAEPAELAEAIDAAIASEREFCALLADFHGHEKARLGRSGYDAASTAWQIRDAIRARSTESN